MISELTALVFVALLFVKRVETFKFNPRTFKPAELDKMQAREDARMSARKKSS